MTIAPGRRLGPYEITAKLGEGGMGSVWRATDTNLGREVALKLLPDDFADDPERHARFEREAKLLASLNHPNIAILHALEHLDGQHALVMELVEGEGLDELISRGPVPVDEALPIARQVAEALEAAHEHGIVHRDLKPANVHIRPDGTVKVLDFGLAKTWEAGDEAGLTHSPTITQAHTAAGVILGTAAYMSPEQARGRPVDKRADIWAFGVVLFEMLAGARLFRGDSVPEVLGNLFHQEIGFGALPGTTPTPVRRLLGRCLERDPRRRLRDIGDARFDLDPLNWEVAHPAVDAGRGLRSATTVVIVALCAVIAGLIGWLAARGGSDQTQAVTRFALHGVGLPVDAFQGLALSPDGRRLVFRARGSDGIERLHVRALDTLELRPLPGSEHGELPFFSPDGERVGFFAQGTIRTIAIAGGGARTVAAAEGGFSGGTWLPDDSIWFTPGRDAKVGHVAASGGPVTYVPAQAVEPGSVLSSPASLPGGRALLCSVMRRATFDVAIFDPDDGSLTPIAEDGFTPTWCPSGHVIFQQGVDGPLMALPFDPKRRRATAPAFPVVFDVGARVSYAVRMFSVAGDGTLAYIPKSRLLEEGALLWVDRHGETTPITEIGRVIDVPRLSRDGSRIAFRAPAPHCDVWVHDLERGTTTRVTREGDNHGVVWTPDGKRLVFARQESPGAGLLETAADGSGAPSLLSAAVLPRGVAVSLSPDGAQLLVETRRDESGADVDLVDVRTHKATTLLGSRFEETSPAFSPDGQYVAFVSDESGRAEVYVQPFPTLDWRVQVSTDGGTEPVWSRNGSELFFRSESRMMVVPVTRTPEFHSGRPRVLFEGAFATAGALALPCYDVSDDGQRFVMVRERSGAGGAEVDIVLGWSAELKRLGPKEDRL